MMLNSISQWRCPDRWILPAILVLTLLAAPAAQAQSDRKLRWQPSPSEETVGYILYVGDTAGFSTAQARQSHDIGSSFTLQNGVAEYPIDTLISDAGYLKMTAYDAQGTESDPSNELFVDAPVVPECSVSSDCSDGNMCNGLEMCSAGVCMPSSGPLQCPEPTSCQTGSCDPVLGCLLQNLPNGTSCDDGDSLTLGDACMQGQCVGSVPMPDPTPDPTPMGQLFRDDFQAYLQGSDPDGWRDTGDHFSLTEDDSLFAIAVQADGNRALHTSSTLIDIHSHIDIPGSSTWVDYEFLGRMMGTSDAGGFGVVGVSGYADGQDAYVRLRSYRGSDFQIRTSPLGESSCSGDTRSGVVPQPNTWYRFRFQAKPEGSATRVRTRVWEDGTSEPADWQTDCLANIPRTTGTVGAWSAAAGDKFWDDLVVLSDVTQPAPAPECVTNADCSDGNACNGTETCQAGSCQGGSPLTCIASSFCMDAVCDPSQGCLEAPANGRTCDDGNACTGSDVCQSGSCAGSTISCPPPTQCQVGSCDSLTGCRLDNLADGTLCDDGDFDTVDDLCGAGVCSGVPMTPEDLPEPDPAPVIGAALGEGPILLFEDFQLYTDGADPNGWLDTNVLLAEDATLFRAALLEDGNLALTTEATVGAHSHFVSATSSDWAQYEYSGQLRISDEAGGIGLTFNSKVPGSEDRYLRVRRTADEPTLHVSTHQGGSCSGTPDSGISPTANSWYEFRIRTHEETDGLRLVARFWREDETEPGSWQIDCTIPTDQTSRFGTVGVWANGAGSKSWDRLLVRQVEADLDVLYHEDFERYDENGEADGWFDTGEHFSLEEDSSLFDTHVLADGNKVLRTQSNLTDIHSTLLVPNGSEWESYDFDGRVMLTDDNGGAGFMVRSMYPQEDSYVRLRTYHGSDFQIRTSPLGSSSCDGDRKSGVTPAPNTWYRFRMELRPAPEGSRIRAKVWQDGTSEPTDWQTDCTAGFGINAGRIGVWSAGDGTKYWDDLRVRVGLTE